MWRWTIPFLIATSAFGPAKGADQVRQAKPHARPMLPQGLPRAHYNYRTTIVYRAPPPAHAVPKSEFLISPGVRTTPLLPGSTTLPGYYGRPFDYYYQGVYYGGPYQDYFYRLPYACGVYGYC